MKLGRYLPHLGYCSVTPGRDCNPRVLSRSSKTLQLQSIPDKHLREGDSVQGDEKLKYFEVLKRSIDILCSINTEISKNKAQS